MSYTDLNVEVGGDYIKLTAGTVVTLHLLSHKPESSVVHWINKKKTVCEGKECEACLSGDKPKQRWVADVWDRKEQKVKKLEFGAMIASQIKAIAEMLAENEQTVHEVDIRIKTTGSNLETEYSVLHVPMAGIIPADVMEKYDLPF